MPVLEIITNVKKTAEEKAQIVKEWPPVFAKLVNKDVKWINVNISDDVAMSHSGSTDPCAMVRIYALKGTDKDNKVVSAEVAKMMSSKFGVPADRFYIFFIDMEPASVGWNGGTFA